MTELQLIKVTQFCFCLLGKSMPKGYVLREGDNSNVVEFFKYDNGDLWQNQGQPVGFYFPETHDYVLRSKYDGENLISFKGSKLDFVVNKIG